MTCFDVADRNLTVTTRNLGCASQAWAVWYIEDSKPPLVHLHRGMQGIYKANLNTGWLVDAPHWRILDLTELREVADELGIQHSPRSEKSPLFRKKSSRAKKVKQPDPRQRSLVDDE